jgi:hypothetical protein
VRTTTLWADSISLPTVLLMVPTPGPALMLAFWWLRPSLTGAVYPLSSCHPPCHSIYFSLWVGSFPPLSPNGHDSHSQPQMACILVSSILRETQKIGFGFVNFWLFCWETSVNSSSIKVQAYLMASTQCQNNDPSPPLASAVGQGHHRSFHLPFLMAAFSFREHSTTMALMAGKFFYEFRSVLWTQPTDPNLYNNTI